MGWLVPYCERWGCPKCGFATTLSHMDIRWCVGPCDVPRELGQHLHVKCACSYAIAMETADAVARRSGGGAS